MGLAVPWDGGVGAVGGAPDEVGGALERGGVAADVEA